MGERIRQSSQRTEGRLADRLNDAHLSERIQDDHLATTTTNKDTKQSAHVVQSALYTHPLGNLGKPALPTLDPPPPTTACCERGVERGQGRQG